MRGDRREEPVIIWSINVATAVPPMTGIVSCRGDKATLAGRNVLNPGAAKAGSAVTA